MASFSHLHDQGKFMVFCWTKRESNWTPLGAWELRFTSKTSHQDSAQGRKRSTEKFSVFHKVPEKVDTNEKCHA